jgi:hypothetical protein
MQKDIVPCSHDDYVMKISRLTVDKLGVKLYDRISAVVAEMVANSYDADAERVLIRAPMGEWLASKDASGIHDLGYSIEIVDDGCGMPPEEINALYLMVGAERRRRGDLSPKFRRKVMGRKGVGKLAPFGVCEKIEVISSGGDIVSGVDRDGRVAEGYRTAHFVMSRRGILQDTDFDYKPVPGSLDGRVRRERGTTIRLTEFDRRRVPEIAEFARQLAQKFGLPSAHWGVTLEDNRDGSTAETKELAVGPFNLDTQDGTRVGFSLKEGADCSSADPESYVVDGPDGVELAGLQAGFVLDDRFYPVTGWVGYAKVPYKDDLMAGIRVYCRGKLAAQTYVFNLKAGFTGEYDVRSYLVGQLSADWLDTEEDLIRTDRQDILWSHELGLAFQDWGQGVVKLVGKLTRRPMRAKLKKLFLDRSGIQRRVQEVYPGDDQAVIRDRCVEMAKLIAERSREEELEDEESLRSIVDLSLLIGPHVVLDERLKAAAASVDGSLAAIASVLRAARIAELASFGRIAEDRVRVIQRLEGMIADGSAGELDYQRLISEAPWLINPQWSPVTANQTFASLRVAFARYYQTQYGRPISLGDFAVAGARPDFVLAEQHGLIHIIEIKVPSHSLQNEEMARIDTYIRCMESFLADAGSVEFRSSFHDFHVTLVCDYVSLRGVYKSAYDGFVKERRIEQISWDVFLLRTRQMHEDYLREARRQANLGAGTATASVQA